MAGWAEELSPEGTKARTRSLAGEEIYYIPIFDYLQSIQMHGMTAEWRKKIIDWFEQVIESKEGHHSETVYVAVNFLDRYLSKKSCDSMNFRLLAIGCLFLATKIEETKPLSTQELCYLGDQAFRAEDIRLMEIELLKTLQWRLHPASPLTYATLLAQLIPRSLAVYTKSILVRTIDLLKIHVYETAMLKFPASMQAVAAMICVFKDLALPQSQVILWLQQLETIDFAYSHLPNASVLIEECGKLFHRQLLSDRAADEEVAFTFSSSECLTPCSSPPTAIETPQRAHTRTTDTSKPQSISIADDRISPPGDVTQIHHIENMESATTTTRSTLHNPHPLSEEDHHHFPAQPPTFSPCYHQQASSRHATFFHDDDFNFLQQEEDDDIRNSKRKRPTNASSFEP